MQQSGHTSTRMPDIVDVVSCAMADALPPTKEACRSSAQKPDTSDQATRFSPTNTSFRNALRRPSTAHSGFRIPSKTVYGTVTLQPGASFSSFAKACLTSSDPTVREQLLESQRSCHQLQADNAVLKEALASSAPHARPVRPQSAGLPKSRAVLSRSSSAVLALTSQGQNAVDEHSSLKGQLAGLKLQLSAANSQVQQLSQQVTTEMASRQKAEQERQHLWEAQLLQQQQSMSQKLGHEKLLQQVAGHDEQQQQGMQKLQRYEVRNMELVAQVQSRDESQQKLAQQCQELQGQLTSSNVSCQQLSEQLHVRNEQHEHMQQALDGIRQHEISCQVQHQEQQQHHYLQLQKLKSQLQQAQQNVKHVQPKLQQAEAEILSLNGELNTQQKLHEQGQRQLQQKLADAVSQQLSINAAEVRAECDQLRQQLTVMTRQNQEFLVSIASLKTKLEQADVAAATAAARVSAEVVRFTEVTARAAESSARVDALMLSETSLRVQLGEAEERINRLMSQHDQKQQRADMRVMLAEHQLQDLKQQLAESLKLYKHLLQSLQLQQRQAEADKEGAKAAQAAAEASRVEADEQARMAGDVIKQLQQQLQEAAAHDAQVHALKGDLVQQGEVHRAQIAAQQAQLQALQSENQEVCLNQHVRQHPWAGRGSGLNGRPHSAISAEGREWQQLTDRMGEVERLHSVVARDAAAMQAMGVLVEAKALKLDVHGSRPSSAGASLTQTIRLRQQVRELQLRLQHAQVPKPE
ncbi:TPA: hypothetical protein ACH3X1_006794 [Trebouxia sp. C0004]